jgi:hypothetical protein
MEPTTTVDVGGSLFVVVAAACFTLLVMWLGWDDDRAEWPEETNNGRAK